MFYDDSCNKRKSFSGINLHSTKVFEGCHHGNMKTIQCLDLVEEIVNIL